MHKNATGPLSSWHHFFFGSESEKLRIPHKFSFKALQTIHSNLTDRTTSTALRSGDHGNVDNKEKQKTKDTLIYSKYILYPKCQRNQR